MAFTIYGLSASPFVRKVRVAMAEKDLAYTLEQVNIFPAPDWFLEISPLKRIPVLRDDELPEPNTLPDSSAICAYLEKKKPSPALYPADAFAYARALWFEEFADTELAANVGMGVFRPIVLNTLMGKEPDVETAQKTLDEKLPKAFDYLEKELGGREFFVGDAFSIADIAVATHFVNLQHAGFTCDASRWPQLAGLVKRMHARPSFKACIDEEAPMFAKTAA